MSRGCYASLSAGRLRGEQLQSMLGSWWVPDAPELPLPSAAGAGDSSSVGRPWLIGPV